MQGYTCSENANTIITHAALNLILVSESTCSYIVYIRIVCSYNYTECDKIKILNIYAYNYVRTYVCSIAAIPAYHCMYSYVHTSHA